MKDVLKGLGAPTLTWIPKGFPGYDATENRWGFDPAKAKAALAESTYKTVDKLPPIDLTFSDSPRNRTRYEWLAAKWKEVLGVTVKLNPVEPTAYTALTKDIKTAPQVFILGWCADYPDPQNWLSVYWKTGAFGARIGYSNKELDKLMKPGRYHAGCDQAYGTLCAGPEDADRRRPGGLHVEQRQHLPGQAVRQGSRPDPPGFAISLVLPTSLTITIQK